ncbi:MAG: anti-CBASS protein Acb1 family protein [Bradymonadaceae bacterium]
MLGFDFNLDSIKNVFTNLGRSGKDRHEHTQPGQYYGPFDERTLDDMYLGGRLNRRIVDRPPEDATRRGWTVKVDDDRIEDPTIFSSDMRRLSFRWKARKAHKQARQSGGALMFFVCDDNNEPHEPIDEGSLRDVETVHVLDRFEVEPDQRHLSIRSGDWREPETWRIAKASTSDDDDEHELHRGDVIHSDRVIKWDGLDVPEDRKSDYDGFGQPILESVWEAIRDLETATQSMATATHQFQFQILKLNDLNSLLRGPDGEPNKDKLEHRLEMIQTGLSFLRMVVLDKEEDIETRSVDFSGLIETYAVFQQNLSAATNMPITLLFGQPPSGFSSEDETAVQNYYDSVAATQQERYRPAIDRAIELLARSSQGPTEGVVPNDWNVSFESLQEPTDDEKAETIAKVAKADAANIDRGVYDSSEARKRYTGDGFQVDLPLGNDDATDNVVNFVDQLQRLAENGGAGDVSAEDAQKEMREIHQLANDALEALYGEQYKGADLEPPRSESGRSDAVKRYNSAGDSSLPQYVQDLDTEQREAFVDAWNATVEQAADLPDSTLESLARKNAREAAGLDDRDDATGKITGTSLTPFVEPPTRVSSLPDDLQQTWVQTYNKFIKNHAGEWEDPELDERALREAWNTVNAELAA